YRSSARPLNDGAYEIDISATQFVQKGKFDLEGNEVEQVEGDAFTQNDLHLLGRYGYGRSLQLFLGISFRQNSSTSGTTGNEVTNSGVESVRGGIHYSFDP